MGDSPGTNFRPWATAASAIGFGMAAVYVVLIMSEGGNPLSQVLPWALLMVLPAAFALVSARVDEQRNARYLLICAMVIWALLGFLSLLSIGLGFLLAAGVASVAITKLVRANPA